MKIYFTGFFRLIFIIFSLYLLGDALSRWDGFSYYATFMEFIPSVALASILWSIVSVFTAVFLWMLFKLIEWFCNHVGIEIEIEHLLFSVCIAIVTGTLAWKVKKLLWPIAESTFQTKIMVLLSISVLSIFAAWLFRKRARSWMFGLINSIAPLVWLFGIFVFLSVPFVTYHAFTHAPHIKSSSSVPAGFSSDKDRPNIVLVTFDALAARNMSLYGYHKPTSPFIERWAKGATVFNMAEAASNFTTPTVASLMTGKRVWTHQTYHIEGTKPLLSEVESLPAVLKENGYFNAAFIVNPFASVRMLGMSGSFDVAPPASEFGQSDSLFGWKFGTIDKMLYRAFGDRIKMHNWILKNDFIFGKFINLFSRNIVETPVPPENAFNSFLRMMDGNMPEPFFAWIHVFPPHDPYLPPGLADSDGRPELRTYKGQEKLVEQSYEYLFQQKAFPETMKPAVEQMRDYYDEFIMYCDKQFEWFIKKLDRRVPEGTIVMFASDHGESFDHGYFTHAGPFLYEQVTNIPLVIKEPGQQNGQVIGDVVEQIDIPATILDFAGIQPPDWMEGRSLLPLMKGSELPARPAFSMNLQGNRSLGRKIVNGTIAVWESDYKLIHYLGRDESQLFNLSDDPDESNNIIESEAETGQRLFNMIKSELNKINEHNKNAVKAGGFIQ